MWPTLRRQLCPRPASHRFIGLTASLAHPDRHDADRRGWPPATVAPSTSMWRNCVGADLTQSADNASDRLGPISRTVGLGTIRDAPAACRMSRDDLNCVAPSARTNAEYVRAGSCGSLPAPNTGTVSVGPGPTPGGNGAGAEGR